ncbi:MAG: germination protein YpeB [Clostridia bacterium]|nr:germination protein YpeB [Clostridia bacterium]
MKSKSLIITLSITLGITILSLLATLVVFVTLNRRYSTQLENLYKRNFYELSTNINDLEVDMSKLVAVNDSGSKREILSNIYANCNMASNNLSMLPVSNSKIENINDFVNVLGGYSYSLLSKVNNNQEFSEEDYANIEDLHGMSKQLMVEYNKYISSLDVDYKIIQDVNFANGESSSFNAGFTSSTKVPTLIYDGPFSDSVLNKEIKGLPKNDVTIEEAEQMLESSLNFLGVQDITYVNESKGDFYTYNFEVDTVNGVMYVQVSKMGGKIVDITNYGAGGDRSLSIDECIDLAEDFAQKLGFEDMRQVWFAENGNILYVNLAPIINGIIYYPDLVKVKVDKQKGCVIALEAQNYWFNHVERSLGGYNITFDTAQANLSSALTVKERNIALIPNKYVGETLTYEYICTWKDYEYYVYIDVNTGKEVNILRIVKTNSGDLMV